MLGVAGCQRPMYVGASPATMLFQVEPEVPSEYRFDIYTVPARNGRFTEEIVHGFDLSKKMKPGPGPVSVGKPVSIKVWSGDYLYVIVKRATPTQPKQRTYPRKCTNVAGDNKMPSIHLDLFDPNSH
jgi:hypothetical protein